MQRQNVVENSASTGVEVSDAGNWISLGGDRVKANGEWGISVVDGAASVHATDLGVS